MAGYFFYLYDYILNIEKYKERINYITIKNTSNVVKDFKNIEIKTHIKTSKKHNEFISRIFLNDLSDNEKIEYQEMNIELNRIHSIFNDDNGYYRFEYYSWMEMCHSAFDIYDDLIDVFDRNKIDIKIVIDILGFTDRDRASEKAVEKDIEEVFERDIHYPYKNKHKTIIEYFEKQDSWIRYYNERLDIIEEKIKNQKKAYIIGKMTEGKANRDTLKKYPELIEAFDSITDIKKFISNKAYN